MSALRRFVARIAPSPVRELVRRNRRRRWERRRPPGPAPGELRAVVYLPTWARWDRMRQRPQYLVQAFAAAGHPAYFVDPREPAPRLVDGVRIVPDLRHVPRRGVVLYVHYAPIRELFDAFDDPVVVYDLHDDLSIYDPDEVDLPPHRRVAAHHAAVVREADVVLVSHEVLAERHRHEAPDLLVVENGVDVVAFSSPRPRPGDLPDAAPIVGYHGAISYWFDVELVTETARRRPEWTFVLVGPLVEPYDHEALERLSRLPNVHLLGERPSDEIPAYVRCFDVGLVPFRLDRMTEAVSPLKMYEYLAAGVPVVATPLPAARATPGVRAASGPAFVDAVDEALAVGRRPEFAAEAAEVAARADWSRRIEPVLARLDDLDLRRVR